MTSKEILHSFSETLLQDERILSPRERELLSNLLQHARSNSANRSNETVSEVIAHAVGETVAQRAFAVLGGQIVEQILQDGAQNSDLNPTVSLSMSGPRPPKPNSVSEKSLKTSGPRPPQPSPGPGTAPSSGPRPPQPSPGPGMLKRVESATSAALMERPEFLPAQYALLDEFLVPDELNEVIQYALAHEADFALSEVVAPGDGGSGIDYEYRRSRVLMDLGAHQTLILNRIQAALPLVMQKLGSEVFPITRIEAQMTASNDGDFFRHHNDNGQDEIASRELTFVYFFHREPKAFQGGELRIYDSRRENDEYRSTGQYQTIVPEQNQIVFFPSSLLHEITPVECSSRAFADSRFTVNGWFHR